MKGFHNGLFEKREVVALFYGGEILGDTYQIISEIGKGGTGVVYLAWHNRLGKEVVVKRIFQNYIGRMNVRAEVDILKRLHHSGLPQVYDFLQIGSDIYTVMEYIQGYDLQYYIDNGYRIEEKQIILWLQQLCSVLEYLHSRKPKILHSDIKPGNIMITPEGNICLIDFNISLDGQNNTGLKGLSERYAAPEQYYKASLMKQHMDSSSVVLDERMDIYSLGATFYTLMTGMLPELTSHRQYPIGSLEIPYSEGLKRIIDKAMSWQLTDRFATANAMRNAVDNVYKYDSKYKKLMLVRAGSFCICAVLLTLGIWLCTYGNKLIVEENFDKAYREFVLACDEYDNDKIVETAMSILNDSYYKDMLAEDSELKAQLLNEIGDVYFEMERYDAASDYYDDALKLQPEEGLYYCNCAIAQARASDLNEAKGTLRKAERNGVRDTRLELAAQEIAYSVRDYEKTVEIGKSLLNESDAEILAKSALITAKAYAGMEDVHSQLEYLSIAYESGGGVRCTRELGRVCLEAAQADKKNVKELLNKSEKCFRELWASSYGSDTDGLNLAITLELKEKYNESLSILEQLINDGTDMYQVYAHAAYVLLQTEGNIKSAQQYYHKAETLYNKTDAEDESFELLGDLIEQRLQED